MLRQYLHCCVGVVLVAAFGGCTFSDMGTSVGGSFDAGAGGKVGRTPDARSGADVFDDISGDTYVLTGGTGGTGGSGAGGDAGSAATAGGGGMPSGGAGGGAGSGGIASGGSGGAGGKPQECVPNSTDSTACGACNSGKKTRKCSSSGTWGDWGACADEKSGYPYKPNWQDPDKKELVCPGNNGKYDYPAVFFVAHPGDESIAMGGAIRHHVKLNRPVFVELLTQGGAALASTGKILKDNKTCGLHEGTHEYDLTAEQFKKAFVAEFTEAVASLGVTGIYVSDFPDGSLQKSDVEKRLNWWLEKFVNEKGIGLKGIVGESIDPRPGGNSNHDNEAVWNAIVSSGVKNIRGYFIYHYITNKGTGITHKPDIRDYLDAKRKALEAYKEWKPDEGWYAIGYHSEPELINKVWNTDHEYLLALE